MSRKTRVFLLALVSLLAALATAGAANAGVRLNGFDFGAYPTVGATVVTSAPSQAAPTLLENGRAVAGLQAVNLGRCKNVVLALVRRLRHEDVLERDHVGLHAEDF